MIKEIACPNYLAIGPWPFAFNQLQWPCDYSQSRPWPYKKSENCDLSQIMPSGLTKQPEISCLQGLVAQVKSSHDNMAYKVSDSKMPSLTTHE